MPTLTAKLVGKYPRAAAGITGIVDEASVLHLVGGGGYFVWRPGFPGPVQKGEVDRQFAGLSFETDPNGRAVLYAWGGCPYAKHQFAPDINQMLHTVLSIDRETGATSLAPLTYAQQAASIAVIPLAQDRAILAGGLNALGAPIQRVFPYNGVMLRPPGVPIMDGVYGSHVRVGASGAPVQRVYFGGEDAYPKGIFLGEGGPTGMYFLERDRTNGRLRVGVDPGALTGDGSAKQGLCLAAETRTSFLRIGGNVAGFGSNHLYRFSTGASGGVETVQDLGEVFRKKNDRATDPPTGRPPDVYPDDEMEPFEAADAFCYYQENRLFIHGGNQVLAGTFGGRVGSVPTAGVYEIAVP